jgi:hypothetical protein
MTTEKIQHKKVYDPLGLEGFELTEGLNSVLINLMGCCGRICFKEREKENIDDSIIEKYDQLATEAMNIKNDKNSWGYYDTMEELLKKYGLIVRQTLRFEKENYPPYVPNKIGNIAV